MKNILFAIAIGVLSSTSIAYETTLVNSKSETAITEALFPDSLEKINEECKQMELAGFRCQSVMSKSALETTAITFLKGSSTLTQESKDFLDLVGTAISKRPNSYTSIAVEGHADPSGNSVSNIKLSKDRAMEVANYLKTKYQINNIEYVGRGSSKLKDTEDMNAPINRRVEFILSR